MKQAEYRFDEETHSYAINGRRVPSVTQVLGDLIPGWHASDWHMQRGRAVHACAAMIARGEEFEHDPQISDQVAACRRFFAECKPDVQAVELQVYSERLQFAGTLDLSGMMVGQPCVLDYKATLTKALPYQLAAYALAEWEMLRQPMKRYGLGVELREDGTYRLSEPYDLRLYSQAWLALLTTYNVRRKCGIKETEDVE